jgi:hypothetical protein
MRSNAIRMKSIFRITVLPVCMLIMVTGCQQPPTYTLAGEVRASGQSPDDGSIAIEPESGGPTRGAPLDHGKFRVERVPAGKARVRFVVRKKAGKRQPGPGAPSYDWSEDLLPARYRDGVMIDVTGDQLNMVFDLNENPSTR